MKKLFFILSLCSTLLCACSSPHKAHYNKGISYLELRRHNQAIQEFNKAIELNPKFAAAYLKRGVAYKSNSRIDQAIQDFTKAIELNPKVADAYMNRGHAYTDAAYTNREKTIRNRKFNRAIQDFTQAIELNPKFAAAYLNRGIVYKSKDRIDQAIQDFSKAIELNPENTDLKQLNSVCLKKRVTNGMAPSLIRT